MGDLTCPLFSYMSCDGDEQFVSHTESRQEHCVDLQMSHSPGQGPVL